MKIFISIAASLISALLLTAASPGYGLWVIAYAAIVPLLVAIRKNGKGFLTGWFFGFFYFAINIRWIVTSVSEFGNAPFIVGAGALVLFSAFLGLFWGVFGWLYGKKRGAELLLAGVIVALEVARSNILTGFPMLNLAHTQYTFLPAIQTAEIAGEFSVSLIIAYLNISLASLITDKNRHSILLALLMLCASFAYGFSVQNRSYAGNKLDVHIIQPAYLQAEKWIPEKKFDIMASVNQMIRSVETEKYDLLMLPETVYPAFLDESFAGYHILDLYGSKLPVIVGGIRKTVAEDKKVYNNSVFMFDDGKTQIYDKIHLVPFGEYFPLKTLFKPINYYFFQGAEDFTPGAETSVFAKSKFTAAPLVCYESMYSSLVRDQVILGADILTVVTNDSWFGDTKGPYQHLAADVFRAVEYRKPLLRAAQSGISACISPSGRIDKYLETGEKGSIDCSVSTHKGVTIFASGGYGWLAVFLFAAWYISRKKDKA